MADPRLQVARLGPCLHRKQTLNEVSRKVLCTDCGMELDAFDLLVRRARKGGYDEMMARDGKALRERVAELRAEEKRVKARLYNARRKDADAVRRQEREKAAAAWSRNTNELLLMAERLRALAGVKDGGCG